MATAVTNNELPVKQVYGYTYTPTTNKNFLRLKARGIPLPPFRVLDLTAKLVQSIYDQTIADMLKVVLSKSITRGVAIHDSAYDRVPMEFRSLFTNLVSVFQVIKRKSIMEALSRQLEQAEKHFFTDFLEDAPDKLSLQLSFALESSDVFKDRRDMIKKLYLDRAVEKIEEGQNALRLRFISRMYDWVRGDLPLDEDFESISRDVRNDGKRFSQFFARDQYARFNKSLQVASYDTAGISKVRWAPMNDGRTRPGHKIPAIKEKYGTDIFSIDNLPDEHTEYLCRCSFIPVA